MTSDLQERLQAASRDERLADGMLYREAAERIAELEEQNETHLRCGTKLAADLRNEQIENKRLREAYHELYAEANSWLTSDQPDRVQLLDAMHSKVLEGE